MTTAELYDKMEEARLAYKEAHTKWAERLLPGPILAQYRAAFEIAASQYEQSARENPNPDNICPCGGAPKKVGYKLCPTCLDIAKGNGYDIGLWAK